MVEPVESIPPAFYAHQIESPLQVVYWSVQGGPPTQL